MKVTVHSSEGPGRPWYLEFDDGSPPRFWIAPPEVHAQLNAVLGAGPKARLAAAWSPDRTTLKIETPKHARAKSPDGPWSRRPVSRACATAG